VVADGLHAPTQGGMKRFMALALRTWRLEAASRNRRLMRKRQLLTFPVTFLRMVAYCLTVVARCSLNVIIAASGDARHLA